MQFSDIGGLDSQEIVALLDLNNQHAKETSLLDSESLNALLASAFFARGVDRGATAFLIALSHTACYANPNFIWFKTRRESFVYVDRVVVSQNARGQGIARTFYKDLFAGAKRAGFDLVVCEVNIDPPNPASEAFHAAMGFSRVGEAAIYGGNKTVGYLEKVLSGSAD